MVLNVGKSKVVIFKKGRGKKEKEKWTWEEEELEEINEFKYLGFHFQRNRGTDTHIRETTKKTMIVMKQTWGIGQRRFRSSFERRMKIYNSLVKSIILYAAEIWGWTETEKFEKL